MDEPVTQRFLNVVDRDDARQLVARYFDERNDFAAELFSAIPDEDPNGITPADLYAVSLLNVEVKPEGARALLLDADTQKDIRQILETIYDIDIWEPAATDHLEQAALAWTRLREIDSIGPVVAGKLLARKRPRLIPIVDSVVVQVIGADAGHYWEAFRSFLESPEHRAKVEGLRPRSAMSAITTLRLLDVAIWMHGTYGQGTN